MIRIFKCNKSLLTSALVFIVLLHCNVIRVLKDTIVTSNIGAEVQSFIKIYGEMPISIMLVLIYTRMCNIMTTERIFQLFFLFFLAFFSIFFFLIYPNAEYFTLDIDFLNKFSLKYQNFKWFNIMIKYWYYSIFYI